MTTKGEQVRDWKEMPMVCSKVLSWHFLETEENLKTLG
jgi:hypothetical protein